MAMLMDTSSIVGDSMLPKDNSFILKAVLKSYKRLQISVDLLGILVNTTPQIFEGVVLLCGLGLVIRLINLITKHLSERFQITELMLELAVTAFLILIRSIIYYSVGHNLFAILLYTITVSGLTTFTIVLLVGLKYFFIGLKYFTMSHHNAEDREESLLTKVVWTLLILWLFYPLMSFMFELYYQFIKHGDIIKSEMISALQDFVEVIAPAINESVIFEPVGIVMLITFFACVLCIPSNSTWTIILILTLYGSCVLVFLVAVYKQVYCLEIDTWAFYSMLQYFILRIVLFINMISINQQHFS